MTERYWRESVTMVERRRATKLNPANNVGVHIWRWEKVPIGQRIRCCMICDLYRATNCPTCGLERVTVHA